jgi:hypothetical protein
MAVSIVIESFPPLFLKPKHLNIVAIFPEIKPQEPIEHKEIRSLSADQEGETRQSINSALLRHPLGEGFL